MIVEASDEVEEGFAFAFGAVGELGLLDEVLLEGGVENEGIEEVFAAGLVFGAVVVTAVFFGKLLSEVFTDAVKSREIFGIKVEFVVFAGTVFVLVLAQILNADVIKGEFFEERVVLKLFKYGGTQIRGGCL